MRKGLIFLFSITAASFAIIIGVVIIQAYFRVGCSEEYSYRLQSKNSIKGKDYSVYLVKVGFDDPILSVALFDQQVEVGKCGQVKIDPIDEVVFWGEWVKHRIPKSVTIKNLRLKVEFHPDPNHIVEAPTSIESLPVTWEAS